MSSLRDRRRDRAPRLKVDIIGRTIGYGRKRPTARYIHADGREQFIVHGSMERVKSNVAMIGRGYCTAVWYDEKSGEWEPA